MKLFNAVFWEFVQNLPLILGFVVASRFWESNRRVRGVLCTTIACFMGAFVIQVTEPSITGKTSPDPVGDLFANSSAFTLLSILTLLYFEREQKLQTDIIVGASLGVLLALIQTMLVGATLPRALMHGLAMAVALPLGMLGLRWARQGYTMPLAIFKSTTITGLVSVVIVLIDYGSLV
jgi:4-amino-4-deoxy-L-arabinose transferase-like glycosyltransferase